MKTALVALAVLLPALVQAYDKGGRPYSLTNGRSNAQATTQVSAQTAAVHSSAPTATAVKTQTSTGVNAVYTGSSRSAAGMRSSGGQPRGHQSFWSGKRRSDGGGTTTSTEEAPPNFSKPGAWIRSEGQQPTYAQATPARSHTVEGGSFVDINNSKGQDVGRSPGVHQGPKDTLPPPNPGSSSSSGSSSITPNSTTNITNNTTTTNGNGGKSHDNDFGGGTGFDPAF